MNELWSGEMLTRSGAAAASHQQEGSAPEGTPAAGECEPQDLERQEVHNCLDIDLDWGILLSTGVS